MNKAQIRLGIICLEPENTQYLGGGSPKEHPNLLARLTAEIEAERTRMKEAGTLVRPKLSIRNITAKASTRQPAQGQQHFPGQQQQARTTPAWLPPGEGPKPARGGNKSATPAGTGAAGAAAKTRKPRQPRQPADSDAPPKATRTRKPRDPTTAGTKTAAKPRKSPSSAAQSFLFRNGGPQQSSAPPSSTQETLPAGFNDSDFEDLDLEMDVDFEEDNDDEFDDLPGMNDPHLEDEDDFPRVGEQAHVGEDPQEYGDSDDYLGGDDDRFDDLDQEWNQDHGQDHGRDNNDFSEDPHGRDFQEHGNRHHHHEEPVENEEEDQPLQRNRRSASTTAAAAPAPAAFPPPRKRKFEVDD